jgi:hypothetical protein
VTGEITLTPQEQAGDASERTVLSTFADKQTWMGNVSTSDEYKSLNSQRVVAIKGSQSYGSGWLLRFAGPGAGNTLILEQGVAEVWHYRPLLSFEQQPAQFDANFDTAWVAQSV